MNPAAARDGSQGMGYLAVFSLQSQQIVGTDAAPVFGVQIDDIDAGRLAPRGAGDCAPFILSAPPSGDLVTAG